MSSFVKINKVPVVIKLIQQRYLWSCLISNWSLLVSISYIQIVGAAPRSWAEARRLWALWSIRGRGSRAPGPATACCPGCLPRTWWPGGGSQHRGRSFLWQCNALWEYNIYLSVPGRLVACLICSSGISTRKRSIRNFHKENNSWKLLIEV